jgi:hypothetical protein
MARFTYHGPVQSISLAVGRTKDKDGREVSKFEDFDLVPRSEPFDLPEDNQVVQAMVARKLLRVAPPNKPGARTTAKQGDK